MSDLEMVSINVADANGELLDWLVEKALGAGEERLRLRVVLADMTDPTYAANWQNAGRIIESERIVLREFQPVRDDWEAEIRQHHINAFGPTPLVAAMRCFVMYKLGDVVEAPTQLIMCTHSAVDMVSSKRMKP